jgi:hypothetical protein
MPGPGSEPFPGPQWHQPPMPQYGRYPSAAYGPPPVQRPQMPDTVRKAVTLIWAGMALAVLTTLVDAVRVGRERLGDGVDANINGMQIHTNGMGTGGIVASVAVGGLIVAGLWLWMALVCRAGRSWGRVVSTVFFAMNTLGLLGLTASGVWAFDVVAEVLAWVIGLVAIILLWNPQSGPYFKPPTTYPFGYGPGPGPGPGPSR